MLQVMHLSLVFMDNQAKLTGLNDVVLLGMSTASPSPVRGITKLGSCFPEYLACLMTVRLFAQRGVTASSCLMLTLRIIICYCH